MLSAKVVKNGKEELVKRAYSLANAPSPEFIELTIRRIENGLMSNHVMTLKEGDVMHITGPFGKFVYEEHMNDIILLGGAHGIVPLMSIIRSVLKNDTDKKKSLKLFYSIRYQDDAIYETELKALAQKHKNFKYVINTTQQVCSLDSCEEGRVDANHIKKFIEKHLHEHFFFICGSPRFVEGMKEILTKDGVDEKRIKSEGY